MCVQAYHSIGDTYSDDTSNTSNNDLGTDAEINALIAMFSSRMNGSSQDLNTLKMNQGGPSLGNAKNSEIAPPARYLRRQKASSRTNLQHLI